MLALLAALLLTPPRAPDAAPPTPHDRVVELVLTADDPALIEGKGPAVAVEHEVTFEGTLHVWTRSELDLFLQVEDAAAWETLGADADGGGGTTPYLRLDVREGDRLLLLVAAETNATGALALHLMAAPETEATRAAATSAAEELAAVGERWSAGELDDARVQLEAALEGLLGVSGAARSEAIVDVLSRLGYQAYGTGQLGAYRSASSVVHEHRERTLPAGHPDLLGASETLAVALYVTGELARARDLQRGVLAAYERDRPADHPDLLRTRRNLASTLSSLGDLAGARALDEAVLAAYDRTLPPDDRDVLQVRSNLAVTLGGMGQLSAARALQESVVAAFERTLPADHPDVLLARVNLASGLWQMGDLEGARALQEHAVEAYERRLPTDHPDLLRARQGLAATLSQMGDLAGSRTLKEALVAAYERGLPPAHPDLLRARGSLASDLQALGDLAGALGLWKSVLAALEETLPPDHPDVLRSRDSVAVLLEGTGASDEARVLFEQVLEVRERTLPVDHPDLLRSRSNLAATLWATGDPAGALALVPDQVDGLRALALGSLSLAPRQAGEAVGQASPWLAQLLFWTRSAEAELQASVFALQETLRLVAGDAARALRATQDPEIQALLLEAGTVRGALNDLVAGTSQERDPPQLSAQLTRLLQQRDRLEREASRLLAERGVATQGIETSRLAQALGADEALIAYRRITMGDRGERGTDEHLLVHVLDTDGSPVRIDLGPASELEALVTGWRDALGASLLRGVATAEDGAAAERATGEALRTRLLDPVLAELGEETRRLHVCADDLVHLVPLDALPQGDGRVGDRWRLASEVSFARLQSPAEPPAITPGLLAVGGVDYDAGAEAGAVAAGTSRSLRPGSFSRLLQTRFETETVAVLFEELLEREPVLLTRKETTKEALFEHAPGKRYVHVATHGWFAPETIRSTLDPEPGGHDWSRTGFQERVTGMAPMLLCGLALAGANQPIDSLGRRPGILTAEELCSLDLSSCELAVLSACETNVGIRRAGQGIQSLQAALYAAGARSSITSLWKVDDAATRRLFEVFYTKLWEDELPKAQALWEAKRVLRDEGAPVRDWAGWVLTGAP